MSKNIHTQMLEVYLEAQDKADRDYEAVLEYAEPIFEQIQALAQEAKAIYEQYDMQDCFKDDLEAWL